MGLAAAGFLVPFVFIYDPALLRQASPLAVVGSAVFVGVGVTAGAGALVGFVGRPLSRWERALMIVAALGLLLPMAATRWVGLALALGLGSRVFRPSPPST